ncbi:putative xylanase/chitin deacetylase [Halobacteroides halobius DSM 5150]|uniref:Putative xylanase/chitin deacetylase n=1 Tax=Halobacteroides halobius (strain ATCC 35273 / DSM 5150 / MD-1) TaxID=748449 RepID=L0K5Y1_HALHC|nr:polysaccharide deacetylase family protein [Halobacteroides halobius]AGB40687.1 putative xylanase/chitin deacetylase [Halobacteroides halobius DSM 5150]
MSKRKIKFFYLPFNRDVVFGLLCMFILLSFGLINLLDSPAKVEQPVFQQEVKPYYHGPTDKQKVALTINVAWGQEYLPKMLDTLDKYDVKATFFFVGTWVKKFPELVKEIKKRGHELGNHGIKHLHPKQLSKDKLINLIKENEKLIQKVADYKTDLFAPPYGEVDKQVAQVAAEIGYKTIMWSTDTIDWQRPSSQVIIKRVLNKIEAGGIVLMHPTKPTAKALPTIINKLEDKGYSLVTVSQLLE